MSPPTTASTAAGTSRRFPPLAGSGAALRWSERLFLAFLVLLPCMWPIGIELQRAYVYTADAMFLAAVVMWLIALARKQTSLRRGSFYFAPAVYLVVMIASAVASVDPGTSTAKMTLEVYLLAMCILTYNVVRTPLMLRRTLFAWMAGTAITAITGVLGIVLFYAGVPEDSNLFVRGFGSLPAGPYSRVAGLFINVNMACNYLSIGLLITLAMRRLGWIGARAFRLLLAAIVVSAAFTLSPGLGGMALGTGLWFWLSWRNTRKVSSYVALAGACIAALAMFAALLISPAQLAQQGIRGAIARHDLQPSSRLLCWEAALDTIRAHPLLGKGTGLPLPCPAYEHVSGEILHLQDAHNSFLNVAALKGILGLAAFLSISFWLLFRAGAWSLASDAEVIVAALAIAFVEAFLYQGLSSSFEHTRHLWVLAGLLAGAVEIRNASRWMEKPVT